jgi:NlpC/P60 family putative phage cell wall peptidase
LNDRPAGAFFRAEDRERLWAELESWLGTPFRHWCGVKGQGVDCIHFVVRVLEATAGVGPLRIPEYSRDWHRHQDASLLLDGIRRQLPAAEVCGDPEDGDVLLFKFGRTASHSSIFCGGRLWHSVTGAGVVAVSWPDRMWRRRFRAMFRVTA